MWLNRCFHYCKDLKIIIKPPYQFRFFSHYNYLRRQSNKTSTYFLKICFKDSTSKLNLLSCRLAHTAKGWKFLAKPKVIENDDEAEVDPSDAPCEEGTGAVPHNVLVSELRDCRTVEEQITTLGSILGLSEEDIANRDAFCEAFGDCLKSYFPPFKVHSFGSSRNFFGFKGCDLDVCLQLSEDDSAIVFNPKLNLPTLEDVLNGTFDKSNIMYLNPKLLLRFIRRVIRKHFEGLREPIIFIKARTPILRFYNEKYDVFCDFSCENRFAMKNTKALRFISQMDPRIVPLVKTIRYWGKHGKFVSDIERFNSYACSLLVMFFLQNTNPPVLPSFESLVNKIDYLKYDNIIDDEELYKGLKTLQPSKNTQTTGELLKDFFHFYLYYDFSRVLLPRTGFSLSKQDFKAADVNNTFELSTVCIDDPFRPFFNQTHAVDYRYCRQFLSSIIEACKLYQNPHLWYPNQSDWGLISLFESTSDCITKYIDTPKTANFEILLKSKEDNKSPEEIFKMASKNVKDIFEYALLFKCISLPLRSSINALENPILNLQCNVVHNTWIGRQLAKKEHFEHHSQTPLMELEHKISTHLANQKGSAKKLFKFLCTCYSLQKNDQTILKVNIKIEEGKLPPNISIFLQDYTQQLLNQLL